MTPNNISVWDAMMGRAAGLRAAEPAEMEWLWGVWQQHIQQDWPALVAEVEANRVYSDGLKAEIERRSQYIDALRAVIAAAMRIMEAIANAEAVTTQGLPQHVLLHVERDALSMNALYLREQARAWVEQYSMDGDA